MIINRIKSERKSAGLTQKELAESFKAFIETNKLPIRNVTYASISRWETGENNPTDETWNALARFFEVEPAYLRGYSNERQNEQKSTFAWIESLPISADKATDRAIKDALEGVYEELNDKISYLQSQINSIEHPEDPEDRN